MTQNSRHFEAEYTRTARLDYLLYLPPGYTADSGQKYPLILFLHGSGERGSDLEKVKAHGLPRRLAEGLELPCIVVSPQCSEDSYWTLHTADLNTLLDDLIARLPVDEKRVYLTGLSMGGGGTWFLSGASPERFAAAAPVCGRAAPLPYPRWKDLPIWAFHGDADDVVPVDNTIRSVESINAAGGNAKMTIYPGVTHDSWTQTYDNPELYEWLLRHKRA